MTRHRLAALMAVAALLLTSAATAQTVRDAAATRPAGTASVSGVVVSTDSPPTPVRLARVTLNSLDRGGAAETATTDTNGRFVFRGLPPGRYALQSSKRAWLDANYGESKLGRPGTPVAVRDGEPLTGLTIRMTRGAVITGVIRDTSGEPQPGVQVRVMRYIMRDGLRTLDRPVSTNPNDPVTEDDGVYRAYGLPPGEYVVVAGLRIGSDSRGLGGEEIRQIGANEVDQMLAPGARVPLSSDGSRRTVEGTVTYSPVYFPGTTDLASAATVTLAPGEERTVVDIPFVMFTTSRVFGTIALSPALATQAGSGPGSQRRAECRMTPEGFEDVMLNPVAASVTTVGADLKLMYPGVPSGRYTIVCAAGAPGGNNGPVLLGWAETSIVVSGQDQDISMSFGPASTMSGRVVFDGANPPKDLATAVRILIKGFGKARLLRSDFDARPQADGTFAFNAIVPGRWAVSAPLPPTSPWALKSLTYGGRELESFIEVAPGDALAELVVTLTDRPSELTGSLQDASGRPASEYFVVAFPTDRAAWTPVTRRIQSTRPASDGAFAIKGLPAGEYFLAALTDVEPGEWLSPAFLEHVVAGAVRVKIVDGEKTTQLLRIAR